MPVFRVWDAGRLQRKAVVSPNCTIEEVVKKGAAKLGLADAGCQLVLEEDGTLIDEDEVLQEFEGKTLLLLERHQTWSSPNIPILLDGEEALLQEVAPPANPNPAPQPPNPEHPDPVQPVGDSEAVSRPVADAVASTDVHTRLRTSPLPKFSGMVEQHLTSNEPGAVERIWSAFIDETAMYYVNHFPEFSDQGSYRIIGCRMYSTYPSIKMEGTLPWRAFNKSLSQKLRHLRHRRKLKSMPAVAGEPTPKKARLPFKVLPANEPGTSAEDLSRHVEEISREWSKGAGKRNHLHIKTLLSASAADREVFLNREGGGTHSALFERYPCFMEDEFVLHAFEGMVGQDMAAKCSNNLQQLLLVVLQMKRQQEDITPDIFTEEPLCVMEAVRFLEKELRSKKHSIVEEYNDIADTDIQKKLKTKEMEGPRIKLFIQGGGVKAAFVAGDGTHTFISVDKTGLHRALLVLIATYYVVNIDYPKPYSSILKLMQKFVFGEGELAGQISNSLVFFTRRVQEKWDKLKNV